MLILIGKEYAEQLQLSICAAQKSVKMIVFCWSLQEEKRCDSLLKINNAVRFAIQKGVKIECLNGSEGLTRQLNSIGVKAKYLTNFKIIHAKFILIDDEILFIGSHNLTKCAMESNLELSIRINLVGFVNEATPLFDKLWSSV